MYRCVKHSSHKSHSNQATFCSSAKSTWPTWTSCEICIQKSCALTWKTVLKWQNFVCKFTEWSKCDCNCNRQSCIEKNSMAINCVKCQKCDFAEPVRHFHHKNHRILPLFQARSTAVILSLLIPWGDKTWARRQQMGFFFLNTNRLLFKSRSFVSRLFQQLCYLRWPFPRRGSVEAAVCVSTWFISVRRDKSTPSLCCLIPSSGSGWGIIPDPQRCRLIAAVGTTAAGSGNKEPLWRLSIPPVVPIVIDSQRRKDLTGRRYGDWTATDQEQRVRSVTKHLDTWPNER